MPTYIYGCDPCQQTMEVVQSIKDKPGYPCPSCGENMYRVIQSTSFALQGGGWAKDGYSKGRGR
jgi:putative FmdB family regulatory protein